MHFAVARITAGPTPMPFAKRSVLLDCSSDKSAVVRFIKGILTGEITLPEIAKRAAINCILRAITATRVTYFEVPALVLAVSPDGNNAAFHIYNGHKMEYGYHFWPDGVLRKGEPLVNTRLPRSIAAGDMEVISTALLAFASEEGRENRPVVKDAISELVGEGTIAQHAGKLACDFLDKITIPPSQP